MGLTQKYLRYAVAEIPCDSVIAEQFYASIFFIFQMKNVTSMDANFGRKKRFSVLAFTGNKNGLAGFAFAKNPDGRAAVKRAKNKSGQKLLFVERYNEHTGKLKTLLNSKQVK